MTKTYEEVLRGTLAELASWAQGEVRGEVTLVLAGAPELPEDQTPEDLVSMVRTREQAGLSRKDAISAAAQETGRPKREVYAAVVDAKSSTDR